MQIFHRFQIGEKFVGPSASRTLGDCFPEERAGLQNGAPLNEAELNNESGQPGPSCVVKRARSSNFWEFNTLKLVIELDETRSK